MHIDALLERSVKLVKELSCLHLVQFPVRDPYAQGARDKLFYIWLRRLLPVRERWPAIGRHRFLWARRKPR